MSPAAKLLSASLLAALALPLAAAPRLNVLFITADDLGLQLGCYGETLIRTPHLDALAASGVRFKVGYVAQASCSPSRSAMFTGVFPHTNGQIGLANRGFAMDPAWHRRTLPNFLKPAGYRTGIIGKLHVNPEKEFAFDERPKGVNTRDVRAVAKAAGKFLAGARDTPFFLMVNYSDPHIIGQPPGGGAAHFPDQVNGLPANPLKPGARTFWPFQGIKDPVQLKRVAGYYNCVQRVDEGVGLLLAELDRAGHTANTLVIFIGDHGPPFARGKTTCYESGLRVPFLVRWPGVSKSFASDALVSTVDIVPTVLDAAGVAPPRELHGRSLRPALGDPRAAWREYLGAEFHFHGSEPFYPRRAVRDGRFKLIHNLLAGTGRPSNSVDSDPAYQLSRAGALTGTDVQRAFDTLANPPEFELYDLDSDPVEFHNLAGRPEMNDTLARLRAALDQWRAETNDPFRDPAHLAKYSDRVRRN